jgi:hypothetical protein
MGRNEHCPQIKVASNDVALFVAEAAKWIWTGEGDAIQVVALCKG